MGMEVCSDETIISKIKWLTPRAAEAHWEWAILCQPDHFSFSLLSLFPSPFYPPLCPVTPYVSKRILSRELYKDFFNRLVRFHTDNLS
jgi:hypothetical protein